MPHVYRFIDEPPTKRPKQILGGKGAGLNEMTRLGIPVPPGFTIATDVCLHFREHECFPDTLRAEISRALEWVEQQLDRKFGSAEQPLLVSVRSGAAVSMPGMMDTILNVGLNDRTVEGLAANSGNRRFAFDAYRRLIQMYGDVVMGVDHHRFEDAFTEIKRSLGGPDLADADVPVESLENLVSRYRDIIHDGAGRPFPDDPEEQLWGAIHAVFESWDNIRAVRYRKMQGIPDSLGTACTIQAMVFGNLGNDSGSGVAFTRNPSTGERALYGEYLPNAQGEDVVAGIRTPLSLTAATAAPGREENSLERTMPEAFEAIRHHLAALEDHFTDMQDVEFTIERNQPFILQTRTGKRTAHAAVKIATDLVREDKIDEATAILRIDPESLEQLLHARLPTPDELAIKGVRPLAGGLPASPGAATGIIVFDADEAHRLASEGKEVILVRRETSPEDIHGMKAAQGIVTATGGMTSHAAVVARGLGKCCVAGCSSLSVDYQAKVVTIRGKDGSTHTLKAGEVISLDGTHGKIYEGALEVVAAATVPEFTELMGWADARRRLRVRANADTPRAAKSARSFGAEGIGLCRTEHMFFAEERLEAVRCMVLANSAEERQAWLERIEPIQHEDFVGIFQAMDGLPVTIRLLDWPLHEFLPKHTKERQQIAKALGTSEEEVHKRAEALTEINPMLGHRGVRVGLTMPELYQMQARAIMSAAVQCRGEGVDVKPEIMIPVVSVAAELRTMRSLVESAINAVFDDHGRDCPYTIGTMIEVPRACLIADDLARHAEFFSFGTNDLTQTTFGISRDDAGRFLYAYLEAPLSILESDPFSRLDQGGVLQLIEIARERGRGARADLKLGLCGEHGGDPPSVTLCHRIGLDYVSCSPPRLPIARLAAAQAAVREARMTSHM